MTRAAAAAPTAPRTSRATRPARSLRRSGRSPRPSAVGWRPSPFSYPRRRAKARAGAFSVAASLGRCAQHLADERHRQAALLGERRFIEGVEQLVERAHVAGKTPLQPVPGFIRQLKSAQSRAQLQGGVLFLLLERTQLKYRTRRAAGAEVR